MHAFTSLFTYEELESFYLKCNKNNLEIPQMDFMMHLSSLKIRSPFQHSLQSIS
jgi:hypothetical protein